MKTWFENNLSKFKHALSFLLFAGSGVVFGFFVEPAWLSVVLAVLLVVIVNARDFLIKEENKKEILKKIQNLFQAERERLEKESIKLENEKEKLENK